MLKDQDKIKELFSEKLGNFQAPVNPELWSSIASQIGVNSTAAAVGTSTVVKGIIGAAAAGVVAVGAYFIVVFNNVETPSPSNSQVSKNEKLNSSKNEQKIVQEDVVEANDSNSSLSIGIKEKEKENPKNNQIDKSSSNIEVKFETNESVETIEQTVLIQPFKLPNDLLNTPIESGVKTEVSTDESVKNSSREQPAKTPAVFDNNLPKQQLLAEVTETPDVFTPNGDNINDELFINYTGELKDFSLVIMNMNNTTIFETKNPDFKWRGEMMNGEIAPNGNYVYIIIARDVNGTPINKYQRLTITR